MDTNLAISDELRIPSYYMIEVGDIVDALFTYSFFQLKPFSKKESQFTTDLEILSGHLSSEPQDQLTKFDRYVHDAIVSIYENLKLDTFTVNMVYHALRGNSNTLVKGSQYNRMITESIERLSSVKIKITVTNRDGKIEYQKQDYLVKLAPSTKNNKGFIHDAYQLRDYPLLADYAASFDKKVLIPAPVLYISNNLGQIRYLVIQYLLRKISGMKRDRTLTNNITIEDLYFYIWGDQLKDIKGNGHSLMRVRDYYTSTLDYWKKQSYIEDYFIRRSSANGRKYTYIEIVFPDTKQITATVQKDGTVYVPKSVIDKLSLQPGDTVCFNETARGKIFISKSI